MEGILVNLIFSLISRDYILSTLDTYDQTSSSIHFFLCKCPSLPAGGYFLIHAKKERAQPIILILQMNAYGPLGSDLMMILSVLRRHLYDKYWQTPFLHPLHPKDSNYYFDRRRSKYLNAYSHSSRQIGFPFNDPHQYTIQANVLNWWEVPPPAIHGPFLMDLLCCSRTPLNVR